MKIKISLELWLPGGRGPVRAGADTLEDGTFGRLAAELAEASSEYPAPERSLSRLSHISGLDPRAAGEFLKSI